MPLYRHDGHVVFFAHIPKTGGTTIEAALCSAGAAEALKFQNKRAYSKSTLQHMHAVVYLEAVGEGFADHSFTVVRNPFARFASEFKMKVLDAGFDQTIDEWTPKNLARFDVEPYTRDNHIRPQVSFLSDRVEVFRFEDGLEFPVKFACDKLGLIPPPTLVHKKRGSSKALDIRAETVELIRTFYKQDFDELGYVDDELGSAFRVID